jgi:long-chain acyl-CoA synthetase
MLAKSWPTEGLNITEKIIDGIPIKVYADRLPSLREVLRRAVSTSPEKTALIYQGHNMTYQEFGNRADRVSEALQRLCAVKKGDRVALLFSNTLEFCIGYFAVTQIGAVCLPLNYRLSSEEMEYQLKDTEARVLIFEDIYRDTVLPLLPHLDKLEKVFITGPDVPTGLYAYRELEEGEARYAAILIDEEDLASIMYTSGTTGRPKGAMLCHRNLICNGMTAAHIMQVKPETKQMILTPLFHASALHSQLISSVLMASSSVIMKEFKTKESLELMDQEKVTILIAVPTMYWFWVTFPEFDRYDLSSIEMTLSGAAPAAPELIKLMAEKFPRSKFINGGGQTESTSFTFALPPEAALKKLGSIGWATPCNEIIVVDEQGRELPVNEMGELWFKGPAVCKGYWNKPEQTRETITNGWLHTGDVGKVDEDGYLFLLDRKKDMIIRGGENIYCIEVENALYSHPKVLEAAVVGVPDKIFGEQVKAVLVLKPGESATEEEIRQFCFQHLADYKVPKFVKFTDALPRNPGGKVVKARLREENA